MLKRINLFLVCLLCASRIQMHAAEEVSLSYRIQFDSCEQHEAEVIQDVLETYQRLTRSVKKKSRGAMILQHIDKFKQDKNDHASFEGGVLKLVYGDGKGTLIEGEFDLVDCGSSIETSSWILEKLGWQK